MPAQGVCALSARRLPLLYVLGPKLRCSHCSASSRVYAAAPVARSVRFGAVSPTETSVEGGSSQTRWLRRKSTMMPRWDGGRPMWVAHHLLLRCFADRSEGRDHGGTKGEAFSGKEPSFRGFWGYFDVGCAGECPSPFFLSVEISIRRNGARRALPVRLLPCTNGSISSL